MLVHEQDPFGQAGTPPQCIMSSDQDAVALSENGPKHSAQKQKPGLHHTASIIMS